MLGEKILNRTKKIGVDNIYDSPITIDNLYKIWNIVRKTCKNKQGVHRFTVNQNINIYRIYLLLKNKKYIPYKFTLFLIYEPKERLVMSQSVGDKIVNHFISNYYLLPYLEKKLIDSNVATRKNKGSRYANELLEKYINQIRLKSNGQEIYCLKLDISKYFYTISHEILLKKLERDIADKDVLKLIRLIISETNKPYVNEFISKVNSKSNLKIPYYGDGVGLSIGAMSSQFFEIYYLNDLDHFIKEKLHCKYYVRYMDDFIILSTDKEYLKYVRKEIEEQLRMLRLKVNPKTNIHKLSIGFTFLGYKYQITNNKLFIGYRKSTYRKIKKRLKYLKEKDMLRYYRTYGSYYGYLKKVINCERRFSMKTIEKYEYYKKDRPKSIVFVKEGSFYKTFKDDAIIIWNIFKYSWNNDSIAFGSAPYSKVIDTLNRNDLSYCVVSDTVIEVVNNERTYDLYLELSTINYKKFLKREKIFKELNELLDKNIQYYDDVLAFLEGLKGASGRNESEK